MNTTVDNLLAEVEQISSNRNYEVIISLMSRLCNYQKANLKLDRFISDVDITKIDYGLDYENWRLLRSLRKKLSFKTKCGLCSACRNE